MSILDTAKAKAAGAMQAAMGAAVGLMPDAPPDPLRTKGGVLGAQVSRVDGAVKVKGEARFAAEVALDRMCYGTLVNSSIARGRIADIDVAAAESVPGVVLVMTHRNAPKMHKPSLAMLNLDSAATGAKPRARSCSRTKVSVGR